MPKVSWMETANNTINVTIWLMNVETFLYENDHETITILTQQVLMVTKKRKYTTFVLDKVSAFLGVLLDLDCLQINMR